MTEKIKAVVILAIISSPLSSSAQDALDTKSENSYINNTNFYVSPALNASPTVDAGMGVQVGGSVTRAKLNTDVVGAMDYDTLYANGTYYDKNSYKASLGNLLSLYSGNQIVGTTISREQFEYKYDSAVIKSLNLDFHHIYSFKLLNDWYLGAQVKYDKFSYRADNEAGSQFIKTNKIDGVDAFGVGVHIGKDTRDSRTFPTTGYFLWGDGYWYSKDLGNDTDYFTSEMSGSKYFSLSPRNVIAMSLYGMYTSSLAPSLMKPNLGDEHSIRGFEAKEIIGSGLSAFNAEYRLKLSNNLRAAVFGGIAKIKNPIIDYSIDSQLYSSYGAGIRYRFSESDTSFLRVDYVKTNLNEESVYVVYQESF